MSNTQGLICILITVRFPPPPLPASTSRYDVDILRPLNIQATNEDSTTRGGVGGKPETTAAILNTHFRQRKLDSDHASAITAAGAPLKQQPARGASEQTTTKRMVVLTGACLCPKLILLKLCTTNGSLVNVLSSCNSMFSQRWVRQIGAGAPPQQNIVCVGGCVHATNDECLDWTRRTRRRRRRAEYHPLTHQANSVLLVQQEGRWWY